MTNRWPAHWTFPVLLAGPDELYFAENKGWNFKARCLRWIGPYFPGSDPACRERTALEQASHESNIKVVVLGDDPAPRQFTIGLMKGEVPWTVTTYDYVAGQWTLTGADPL